MEKFHFYRLDKIHQDAIRCIRTFMNHNDCCQKMITVSRDSEAKIFTLRSNGLIDFHSEYTFFLSTQISTVTVLDRDDLPTPMFIFGCLNGHIYVFHGYEQNASQCITEHSNNVCIVRSDSSMTRVATGSWDHTAIVFKIECGKLKKMIQISGHTQSVMDLMFLGQDRLLTASSDRSIVLWDIDTPTNSGIQLQSFMGHEDCVRGLLMAEDNQNFYSISNDQTIRLWNLNTAMSEKIYVGHEHFIFDINRLPDSNDGFITCGENNAVLIWQRSQTSPFQILKLPTVTIWSVLAPNRQIFYAAGSDGILYAFTNHPDLKSDTESQSLYNEMMIKQTKIPHSTVAHLKLYEENSLLTISPKGNGDRRLIRSMVDDTVLVYEWNEQTNWKPIGCVADYNSEQTSTEQVDQISGRVPYNDEFYDEVFNVKLNNKTYKLPYNRDQDPWQSAQSFIEQNQLDYGALTSLVQCIVKYASYKPKQQADNPFISYSNYYPLYEFKLWTQMPNLEAFKKKFHELNETVPENLRLAPEHLQATTSELENPESFCAEFCDAFEKLFNWPTKIKFIVYDLLRVLLTNKYFNTYFLHQTELTLFSQSSPLFSQLVHCEDCSELAAQLTSLRVLANLFSSVHGAEFMYKNFSFIHSNLIRWNALTKNLNVHLAYASIWYNYSVLLTDWKKKQNIQLKRALMNKIQEHGQLEIDLENYDKVILDVMNTFGNLLASNFQSEESDSYLKLIQTYPDQYKTNSYVRYQLRQIEMIQL